MTRHANTAIIKPRIHFTDRYLVEPQHPVTVNVIGAGGTGSQVVTSLARIDVTLRALGHPGLFVTVWDPDTVSESNIGRQLFSPSELDLNKAECLVTRINRFFGSDWRAVKRKYPVHKTKVERTELANITITCTDNIRSRLDVWKILEGHRDHRNTDHTTPLYWMDLGNAQSSGQVVLGTVRAAVSQPKSKKFTTVGILPVVTRMFDFRQIRDEDSGPSCSLAEALTRQDLFINSTLAQLGCDLLWKMIREGMIEHQGLYLNLDTMRVVPIGV